MGDADKITHPFWREHSLPIAKRLNHTMNKLYNDLSNVKESSSEMYVWLRKMESLLEEMPER